MREVGPGATPEIERSFYFAEIGAIASAALPVFLGSPT
jgi:hypothetical protein